MTGFRTRKRRTTSVRDFLRRIAGPAALLALCSLYWQPASAHDLEGSLFLMARDGSSVARISTVEGVDTPCWKPDGRSVLYLAHTGSESAFHLVSTAGELLTRVPLPGSIAAAGGLSWRPDGTGIAFAGKTAEPEGTFDIYGTKLETDPELRLIVTDGILPAWSPDGHLLAFTTFHRDGNMELYVVDRDGGNLRNLTRHKGYDARGTWSPDGDRIAFESNRSGNVDIWVVEVASGDAVRVTDHPGEDREPVWTPDGKIAFASNRDGPFSIYLMAADGSGVTRLTPGNYDRQPVWSPDGDSLCFVSNRSEPFFDGLHRWLTDW